VVKFKRKSPEPPPQFQGVLALTLGSKRLILSTRGVLSEPPVPAIQGPRSASVSRPRRGGFVVHRKPGRLPDVALDEEIEERADERDRGEAPDVVPVRRAGRDDDVVGELERETRHQPAGVAQVAIA